MYSFKKMIIVFIRGIDIGMSINLDIKTINTIINIITLSCQKTWEYRLRATKVRAM